MIGRLWYSFNWLVCAMIAAIWFRYRVTGKEHVPKTGSVLLLCNHQSHLDPVLVGIACPRQLRYLARDSLFFWPLSWLIRSLGAIPIDREGTGLAGLRASLKVLRNGEALLLFPEGTRTKDGNLQSLKPGFCAVARRGGATLVPVAITGAFHALPRGSKFPRPCKISLRFAPPLGPEEVGNLDDEQLVNEVASRIAAAIPN